MMGMPEASFLPSVAVLVGTVLLSSGLPVLYDAASTVWSRISSINRHADVSSSPIWNASDVKILSFDPLIAHIRDFVTPDERIYIKELAQPLLSRSTVLHANGSRSESEDRTSSTAFLSPHDPIVATLAARASRFQGYLPVKDVQVTSYQEGQKYVPHWDWFLEHNATHNRFSTFFAILEADCSDCGTQFPELQPNWAERDPRLCEYVDCEQSLLTTRNIEGSAVFWLNLHPDGRARRDVLHAGLPALGGTKVGLNIWTEISVEPTLTGVDNAY